MTVVQKVSKRPCLTMWFACSLSPVPLLLATRAVIPVFMEIKAAIKRNLGCVVKPTADKACAPILGLAVPPMEPTIIKSTIEANCVKRSSTKLGHAIRTIS